MFQIPATNCCIQLHKVQRKVMGMTRNPKN